MKEMNGNIKLCVICGDIAIAKNFGALSCKSCKPFFRRNAKRDKIFKCKYGDNCQINTITRKRCRKCRLDKCFAVGMRPELILNDVEKHFRRSLVEENRKKKRRKYEEINPKVEDNDTNSENFDINSEINFAINSFELFDEKEESFDSNSGVGSGILVCDQNIDNKLIEDQTSSAEVISDINEVIQKSSDSNPTNLGLIPDCLPICRPLNNYENNFTELEEYKLSELFHIFQPIANSWNKNCILFDVKDVREMVNTGNFFYEKEIKNFARAIKKLSIFETICENDRIALVKYSCIDILSLRAIQCFDLNKDSWVVAFNEDHALRFNLNLFKALKRDIYLIYRNYLIEIIKECDSDTIILDLLTAISLFNPNRQNLINREIVKTQQHIYLYLLQRYLTFKYRNKSDSEYKSVKLLNTLTNAHILGQLEKKYFIEDYQEQYCPLVKEVFDL